MKTTILPFSNRFVLTTLLLLSWISMMHAQQIIRFKEGQEKKVIVLKQENDSVTYNLPQNPEVTKKVSMSEVEMILSNAWDTTGRLWKDKKYIHYRHGRNLGVILTVPGALLSVAGIAIMASAQHTNDDFWGDTYEASVGAGAFVTVIGCAMVIPGVILASVFSHKLKMYERKIHGLSFNLRVTPGSQTVSVVYRF